MRYLLEVRLAAGDVGSRVVIRWRRPAGNGEETADVLGVLEAADAVSFTVRKASGELVTIPRERALAGKTVPARSRAASPARQDRALGGVTPGRSGWKVFSSRECGMTMVRGDPEGFAVDWDWQRGLTVWVLAGRRSEPRYDRKVLEHELPARPARSGRRGPRHAAGGGRRAALGRSARPEPAPGRLSGDLRIPRTRARTPVAVARKLSASGNSPARLPRCRPAASAPAISLQTADRRGYAGNPQPR